MYDAPKVEKKWQKRWAASGLYTTPLQDDSRKKFYHLVMFPYPSGDKLHIGHWYNFAPADSYARYMRMKGYHVFEPMGFDSFGLPAENYAIKTGVHPTASIAHNCETMRKQLRVMGTMYDWSQEVVTSDPEYYQWTQWIFLQLYKKGLAYRKEAPVNWCPSCQTVLANEQVVDGKCERCKSVVTPKHLLQWFFKIRDYAEQLLDYSELDWPEKTILMQQEWIRKSEGVTYLQKVKDLGYELQSFDSVPQTFVAQTFCSIAPDHPLVSRLVEGTDYEKPVIEFVEKIKQKKMKNKFDIEKDLDGVFTGRYVDNPFGTGDLPIWVASFVVMDYGSGIVNCSAHDERDFSFAKKYDIPLRPVMFPADPKEAKKVKNLEYCYHHHAEGILQYPHEFQGRRWGEVRDDILRYLEKKGLGKRSVNYKLRDWLISRQRYWGAPIPMIYCPKCGEVPVPEKDLPVLLPRDVDFIPRGRSPLAYNEKFIKTKCPKCRGAAERADETMDTFVDSSWYFLRYPCARMKEKAFDPKMVNRWLPVDLYIGGPEHACMHLLYARFIHKVLYDLGYVQCKEPFKRLFHQGLITKNSAKMSKSKGNVVSPDAFVSQYGSDIFRLYLMFMGPFEAGGDWSDKGITGIVRFVERFWKVMGERSVKSSPANRSPVKRSPANRSPANPVMDEMAMKRLVHKTIARVTKDIEILHFNTALAALMEFLNAVGETGIDLEHQKIMTRVIAPLAPHLAEEIWEKFGEKESVFNQSYPLYDASLIVDASFELVVQVNGKVRGKVVVQSDIAEKEALRCARGLPNVSKYLEDGKVLKELYVKRKLVSFVVRAERSQGSSGREAL